MEHLGVTARDDRHPRAVPARHSATLGHAPFGIDWPRHGRRGVPGGAGAGPARGPARPGLRERAGPAADVPADEPGFVVGTGDLSELALGWSTYNGDHMSMYNPNCSIPKTLVKFLVRYAADERVRRRGRSGDTLLSIVGTTISPELLPTVGRRRDRAVDRGRRSAPTSCTTSSCSTRSAAATRRRRSCFLGEHADFTRPFAAGADRADLADLLPAVLRQPVQALVPARRPQGRLGQPLAPRRLADAQRRRPHGLALIDGLAETVGGGVEGKG